MGELSSLSGADMGENQSITRTGTVLAPDNPHGPQVYLPLVKDPVQEQLSTNQPLPGKHHPAHKAAMRRRRSLEEHK